MTTFSPTGYALAPGDGQHIWFLGSLMTVKAGTDQTRGGFTLIEQVSPPAFAAPSHVHDAEEEAFYVLDGQLEVTCGEQTWRVEQGGFVLLPRGIPHGFSVLGERGAKLLQITSPAGFEDFAIEAGDLADRPALPPTGEPNLAKLFAAMARYGKRMAGAQGRRTLGALRHRRRAEPREAVRSHDEIWQTYGQDPRLRSHTRSATRVASREWRQWRNAQRGRKAVGWSRFDQRVR